LGVIQQRLRLRLADSVAHYTNQCAESAIRMRLHILECIDMVYPYHCISNAGFEQSISFRSWAESVGHPATTRRSGISPLRQKEKSGNRDGERERERERERAAGNYEPQSSQEI